MRERHQQEVWHGISNVAAMLSNDSAVAAPSTHPQAPVKSVFNRRGPLCSVVQHITSGSARKGDRGNIGDTERGHERQGDQIQNRNSDQPDLTVTK